MKSPGVKAHSFNKIQCLFKRQVGRTGKTKSGGLPIALDSGRVAWFVDYQSYVNFQPILPTLILNPFVRTTSRFHVGEFSTYCPIRWVFAQFNKLSNISQDCGTYTALAEAAL
jgi:hypothetical protein